jgi:hypothetical protein
MIGEKYMLQPSQKDALSFVLCVLLFVGSSACAGMATPDQLHVQTTPPPVGSTAQLQVPQSTGTPEPTFMESTSTPILTIIPPRDTPPIPTASPTASFPPLEILNDQCFGTYGDGGFVLKIVGEVRNNTSVPMIMVLVEVIVYDGNNEVLGISDSNETELDLIPSGGRSPYMTGVEWTEAVTCKARAQGMDGSLPGFSGYLPRQDLIVLSSERFDDGKFLRIRGEVQNTGTTPVDHVLLVGTFYDPTGKVIDVDSHHATLDTIPAGGISTYELTTGNWYTIERYEIQVQGRDVKSP